MVAITRISGALEIARQGRLSRSIADGQERIATGQRLSKASNAPADWAAAQRITRTLNQADAWNFAIQAAQARANQAGSALANLNENMTRAQELMVLASGPSGAGAGRDAIIAELQGIRASVENSLSQHDGDGIAIFDGASPHLVPAGAGLALPAVAQRSAVDAVATANGLQSYDAILANAIAAVQSGGAALASAGDAVSAAQGHAALEAGKQGLRGQALQAAADDIATLTLDLAEARSALTDSDISAEIIRVQQQMTALDAARASFARLGQRTLFDLIG